MWIKKHEYELIQKRLSALEEKARCSSLHFQENVEYESPDGHVLSGMVWRSVPAGEIIKTILDFLDITPELKPATPEKVALVRKPPSEG